MVQTALDTQTLAPAEPSEPNRSSHPGFVRLFIRRNRAGAFGFVVLGLILLITFIGPFFVSGDIRTDTTKIYEQPSWAHPLGYDYSGKDVWVQIVNGGRSLILVAATAALIGTAFGVIMGALAAMIGGTFDSALLTLSDIVLTLPQIIVLGVLAAFIRLDNAFLLILILSITSWPVLLLAVRSQVLSLKEREYVEAARTLDLGLPRILLREVLPNMASYIVINLVFHMTGAIYGQVILYFLGLVPLQGTNWGLMIQDAYRRGAVFNSDSILGLIAPMFIIVMLLWSLTLIARSLEDIFNPRLREI